MPKNVRGSEQGRVTVESLDSLLPDDEPHATFHDARLVSLSSDGSPNTVTLDWSVCVGDPDSPDLQARERFRTGRLTLDGVVYWVSDPAPEPGAWLTATGPVIEADTPVSGELAARLSPDMVDAYLYFSDTNSFAYFAAASASFRWTE